MQAEGDALFEAKQQVDAENLWLKQKISEAQFREVNGSNMSDA